MPQATLLSAARALREGRTTSVLLVQSALAAAQKHANLNAISHLAADASLQRAAACDADRASGKKVGLLHGLPITVKDLFAVRGMPMSASTRAPLPDLGCEQAVAVDRLVDAGAIILGKANMHEIALGVTGEFGQGGPTRNPHDSTRQTGGSSSGSAAGTVAGIGLASVGSDTACSIRLPAAYCGLVGFKPTFGHIPLDGALPLSATCDHAGPLALTVADAGALYEVMAQRVAQVRPVKPVVLGVLTKWLDGWLAPTVRPRWNKLLQMLRDQGVTLRDVGLKSLTYMQHCFNLIRDPEALFVHRRAISTNPDGFSPVVRDFLLRGTGATAESYLEGMALRREMRAEHDAVLAQVDALLIPTAPWVAPKLGQAEVELEHGPEKLRDGILRLNTSFNLTGHPSIGLPYDRVDGMPLGVQLVGEFDRDARLLCHASWLESQLAYGDFDPA